MPFWRLAEVVPNDLKVPLIGTKVLPVDKVSYEDSLPFRMAPQASRFAIAELVTAPLTFMRGFLLNNNIPSEMLRPRPDANVAAWVKRQANETLLY
jgi:hypothetical protein